MLKLTKAKQTNAPFLYPNHSGSNDLPETFEISSTNPVTHTDYAGYLQCKVGEKIRPTPNSRITFMLLITDTNSAECEFEVLFDGDAREYQGTVRKGESLAFSPKVARMHISLVDIGPNHATLLVPGLISHGQ